MITITYSQRTIDRIKRNAYKGIATVIGKYEYFYFYSSGIFSRIECGRYGIMEDVNIIER